MLETIVRAKTAAAVVFLAFTRLDLKEKKLKKFSASIYTYIIDAHASNIDAAEGKKGVV